MSQYLLDCNGERSPKDPVCTLLPYAPPPETVTVYEFATTWMYVLAFALALAFIIAVAVVRFNAHSERGMTERSRIKAAMQTCQTCGAKAVEET